MIFVRLGNCAHEDGDSRLEFHLRRYLHGGGRIGQAVLTQPATGSLRADASFAWAEALIAARAFATSL